MEVPEQGADTCKGEEYLAIYSTPRFCTTCRGATPEQRERWRLEDQLRRERNAAKERRRQRLRALLVKLIFWRHAE